MRKTDVGLGLAFFNQRMYCVQHSLPDEVGAQN